MKDKIPKEVFLPHVVKKLLICDVNAVNETADSHLAEVTHSSNSGK